MHVRWTRIAALMCAAALSMFFIAACGDDDNESSSSGSGTSTAAKPGGEGGKIALLLPETKTARYESQDRPLFEAKVKELCPDCEVIYSNADQDAAKQQQQAEAALTQGAKVLVLDPVDGAVGRGDRRRRPSSQEVPVISYDRLIAEREPSTTTSRSTTSRSASCRATRWSQAQGGRQVRRPIVMINGSPTDNNADALQAGRAQRARRQRLQGRQGVRHARLEPGQGPGRWSRRSPRVGKDNSSASTPPTTAPPAARSRR